MVSAVPTDELCLDLETDKVLSEGQLLRHYGYPLSRLSANILTFNAFLSTTHHSMTYREVFFVTLERKHTRLSASALRHLAGVAEMRRMLCAPVEQWHAEASARCVAEQPDAVWESLAGDIAIEYDAGSYSPQKIRQKICTFERYEDQVWGSSSRKRVRHLKRFLQEAGEFTPPIFVTWH